MTLECFSQTEPKHRSLIAQVLFRVFIKRNVQERKLIFQYLRPNTSKSSCARETQSPGCSPMENLTADETIKILSYSGESVPKQQTARVDAWPSKRTVLGRVAGRDARRIPLARKPSLLTRSATKRSRDVAIGRIYPSYDCRVNGASPRKW